MDGKGGGMDRNPKRQAGETEEASAGGGTLPVLRGGAVWKWGGCPA